MSFGNLHMNWKCAVCNFRIMVAPGEKGPRHCPHCYKKAGKVIELDKVPLGK